MHDDEHYESEWDVEQPKKRRKQKKKNNKKAERDTAHDDAAGAHDESELKLEVQHHYGQLEQQEVAADVNENEATEHNITKENSEVHNKDYNGKTEDEKNAELKEHDIFKEDSEVHSKDNI